MALGANPALGIARHERNLVRLDVDRQRPAFRPEIIATASQTFQSPRVDLPGPRDRVVLPNFASRVGISVRQPLYQFGVGDAATRLADARVAAAESGYRRAELDVVLQTREAYLDVLRAERGTEVAARSHELAREQLRITRLLIERGLAAAVDALEAERGLAEAGAAAVGAENGSLLARANLNRMLGRDLEVTFQVREPDLLPAMPPPLAELVEQARRGRPEVTALRHQMQAAGAGIRLARASGKPRVELEAGYALQTRTALAPFSGVSAAIQLTFPIWDRSLRAYTVREAEERLAQLSDSLVQLELGISLEIQQQRLADATARARSLAADRAVDLAQKEYEIKRLRLELGRALQLEMLNARLELTRVWNEQAAARFDVRLARARLERAVGGALAVVPEG